MHRPLVAIHQRYQRALCFSRGAQERLKSLVARELVRVQGGERRNVT
jgi:hypothetical protein